MNFLAHLHLSPPDPELWIGALLPDLSRTRDLSVYPANIALGAELHRRVDRWTDTHPAFLETKALLFAHHGRYSGILADLFFDHILATDWPHWHHTHLPDFIAEVYQAYASHGALMPTTMRVATRRMRRDDWLGCYDSIEGMRTVLGRMSMRFTERFKRAVDLRPAADTLAELKEPIGQQFKSLYPDLQRKTHAFLTTSCDHPSTSHAVKS